MSIRVVQMCNGCGATRDLSADNCVEADQGGWREVKHNTHLCPVCIRDAVKITPGGKTVSS